MDLDRAAGDFTLAEQQLIEIARALVTQPRILIMDEPTSSLTQTDTERLFETILRLKTQGVSIIYISHFLEECRRVADRYTVLKDGISVGGGDMRSAELDRIVTLMTGRKVEDLYPRQARTRGPVALEVKAVARAPRLRRASFAVHQGEIFGLAGSIGAGRTDLLRAIFCLDPPDSGEVSVAGVGEMGDEGPSTPRNRWREGLWLPEREPEGGGS